MNKFASLSTDEFKKRIRPEAPIDPEFLEQGILNGINSDLAEANKGYGLQAAEPSPTSKETPIGIVSPETKIKDQGTCGSCWAVSGSTLLEVFLKNTLEVSPKLFMDCRNTPFDCNNDEHAGNFQDVMYVLRNIGYTSEALVPYSYSPDICKSEFAVGKGRYDSNIHVYTFVSDDKYEKGKHPLEHFRVSSKYLEKHLN